VPLIPELHGSLFRASLSSVTCAGRILHGGISTVRRDSVCSLLERFSIPARHSGPQEVDAPFSSHVRFPPSLDFSCDLSFSVGPLVWDEAWPQSYVLLSDGRKQFSLSFRSAGSVADAVPRFSGFVFLLLTLSSKTFPSFQFNEHTIDTLLANYV